MVFLQLRWETGVYSRVTPGMAIKNSCFSWRLNMAFRDPLHLKQENTGSLSHTYSCGKTPLELLVESFLISSVEDRESALISTEYGLH